MSREQHWRNIYGSKPATSVSWYQQKPLVSLSMIAAAGIAPGSPLIDIGGGASKLVDCLINKGYSDLTILDIAPEALEVTKQRLGDKAASVDWIIADVTAWTPNRRWTLWHDRAVFHFLTDEADRRAYRDTLASATMPNGHVIIATFAPDGPEKCSGLPVIRHDEESLCRELGSNFRFVESRRDLHMTPDGSIQPFLFQRFVRA